MKVCCLFPIIFLIFMMGCATINIPSSTTDDTIILIDCPVWISHSTGIQCQQKYFQDLKTAIQQLKNYQIEVLESRIIYKAVQSACGYPSGMYYAAKIRLSKFEDAKKLGWKSCEVYEY